MVSLKVDYEIVEKEYKDEIPYFLSMLENSKCKDVDQSKLEWYYSFSYFLKKSDNTAEYYSNLYNLCYDERLAAELAKVRVSIGLSAKHFYVSDKVAGLSDSIISIVSHMTVQKMVNEQEFIQNQVVIDSIPQQETEVKPLSLDQQLQNAIDSEDYLEAARIRDIINNERADDSVL